MPSRRSRKLLLGGLAVLGCVALVLWLVLRRGGGGGQLPSRLRGNEKQLVTDYIRQNANDASSVEIAEWEEPRFVLLGSNNAEIMRFRRKEGPAKFSEYEPAVILQPRWREKNPFGAKTLREGVFLVKGDKVVKWAEVKRGHIDGPYAFNWALGRLGETAAVRYKGELTEVIIRGKVTVRGRPVSKGLRVSLKRVDGEWERIPGGKGAATVGNRYELSAVSPGTYRVTIGWEDKKVVRPCVVTDKQEIQTFDFNIDATESAPRRGP